MNSKTFRSRVWLYLHGRLYGECEERNTLTIMPDWPQEEAEQAAGANGGNEHLWEESWDDDDAAEDFSKQLK